MTTAHAAATSGIAGSSPFNANPFYAALIGALLALFLIAVGIGLALLLSLLTLSAELDNAVSDWRSVQSGISDVLRLLRLQCGFTGDVSMPTCSAIGG
jgi:hypothetical protein